MFIRGSELIIESSKIRCDNCFFSLWMIVPNRPVLMCMQRVNFVGRWRGVHIDCKCTNFYPSSTFLAGSAAVRKIPLTQGKFALVDADDYYQLSKFNWITNNCTNTSYAARNQNRSTVKMHRVIMNAPDHLVVDHIDHNGLNNCKSNLRLCTSAQNAYNAVSSYSSTSKYKGLYWDSGDKRWIAKIQANGKRVHIGYFTDEIEAAKAYDEKASQLHGEFACLNFPPPKGQASEGRKIKNQNVKCKNEEAASRRN